MRNLGLVSSDAHPYSLTIDGQDVIDKVPLESITITEAGPGAVSSMHFTTWDTDASVEIGNGAEIIFHDNDHNLRPFGGFLEAPDHRPAFGGSGRIGDIGAFGYESYLDTIINPTFDIATGTYGSVLDRFGDPNGGPFTEMNLLQALVSNAPFRAFGGAGSQAEPIKNTISYTTSDPSLHGGAPQSSIVAIAMAGQTLRQSFEAYLAAVVPEGALPAMALTVDFYRGVRLFPWGTGADPALFTPTDYTTLIIGSGVYASSLSWQEDHSPGAIINAVYVKGGAVASTGWVVGDTTTGRRESYVTITGTTAEQKYAAAQAILGQRGTAAGRGTLTLENFTPINAHPGGRVVITNAQMPGGWSSKTFLISQIDKTFVAGTGKQNWTVSFFDPADAPTAGAPSDARLIRRLTRDTN
jgi:hypothetical protein